MANDDLTLEAASDDDDLPDPGVYSAVIDRLEPFTGGAFGPAFKLVFRITGGDWDGTTVEGIASRPDTGKATKKTKIFNWYAAAMGEPQSGTRMHLRQMVGRSVQVMVEHKQSENGGTWAKVREVLPAPQPRRRAAPPLHPTEELDDLEDA